MRAASLLLMITSLLFSDYACSQNVQKPVQKDWTRVYVKDVGHFDIPPTMEIQKGLFKKFVENYREVNGYDTLQLTVQQRGVNDFTKESQETFARIDFETAIDAEGDNPSSNFDMFSLGQDILTDMGTQIDELYKDAIKNSPEYKKIGMKLIEWYPMKFETINGMLCYHMSWKRQFSNNPYVMVNMYIFPNNDREHTITMSYRIEDAEIWKADFEKVLDSFRITNLK
ncbi:MAG: hypothetical protein RL092_285 [Bacteroidota bacterium]|jgi:hypothetical protein